MKKHLFQAFFLSFSITVIGQVSFDSMLIRSGELYQEEAFELMLELCRSGETLCFQSQPIDSSYLADFRMQIGNAFYGQGKYEKAIENYNSALLAAPQTDSGNNTRGRTLFERAFAEYALQQYLESHETVKKSEAILSDLKDPDLDYLLSIYGDLGSSSANLGFYDEGEFYLRKGLKILKKNRSKIPPPTSNQASKLVLFNYKLIEIFAVSGKEKKVIRQLKEFEKLRVNHKKINQTEQLMYAVALNAIADFYINFREKFDLTKAMSRADFYLKKAFENLDRKSYPDHFLQFKFNQAKIFYFQKNYQKTIEILNEINALAKDNDARQPFFAAMRGNVFRKLNQAEQTEITYRKMANFIHRGKKKLLKKYENFQPSSEINHAGLLMDIAEDLVKDFPNDSLLLAQANSFFKMSLTQFINCYHGNIFNKKLRDYYERSVNGILKMKNQGWVANEALAPLLNQIENIENRLAWQEFLANRNANLTPDFPDSIFQKERKIRADLIAARQANFSERAAEIENALQKFEKQLYTDYPKLFAYAFKPFELKKLQNRLSSKTVILKYEKLDSSGWVFQISKNKISCFPIEDFEFIEQQTAEYLSKLKAIEEDRSQGNFLFRKLIPKSAHSYQKVIILPEGILNHLPFEALVDSDENYAIQTYEFSYAGHLVFVKNQFKNQVKSASNGTDLMIFAPRYKASEKSSFFASRAKPIRLQGAKDEAVLLTDFFKGQLFRDEAASKEKFIKNAPNAKLLHLAGHAEINHEQPTLSRLLFGNDTAQSLFVEELYGLNLQADLAVLSACNTGVGSASESEGLVSLQRAFTFAGVPAVVASLWEVPDRATADIMVDFYKNLKTGQSKSAALRAAKLQYLNKTDDPNFRKPFFWAGFVTTGNQSAIYKNNNWLWFGILGISCFVGLRLFNRKNNS